MTIAKLLAHQPSRRRPARTNTVDQCGDEAIICEPDRPSYNPTSPAYIKEGRDLRLGIDIIHLPPIYLVTRSNNPCN
jgi:hypothetical protein